MSDYQSRTDLITSCIAQIKREVLDDMANNVVPHTVRSFSELHDHVDANEYGGMCDPDSVNSKIGFPDDGPVNIDDVRKVQDAVDEWLKQGAPANQRYLTLGDVRRLAAHLGDDTPLIAYSDTTDYVNLTLTQEDIDSFKEEDGQPCVVFTLKDDFDTRQW